jgi:single-stranded DNA-binding protein
MPELNQVVFAGRLTWDKVAEKCGQLCKGRPVLIEKAELSQETFKDKDTQKDVTKTGLTAYKVTPLDWEDSQPSPAPKEAPIPEDDIPF